MKVIKQGAGKKSFWKKSVICTGKGNNNIGCGAKLEINGGDVYMTESHHYDGSSSSYFTFMCPCCEAETDINEKEIPYAVQHCIPFKKEWLAMNQNESNEKPNISLRDVPDFPKKGIMFKDISPLLYNPKEFKECVSYIAKKWDGKIDVIAGFDARGFIFASALALHMNLPFVMLRKAGKLPGAVKQVSYGLEYGESKLEIQESEHLIGKRVLLVDDVLATGGTAEAGAKLIEMSSGVVAGLQFIIELSALEGKKKLSSHEVCSVLVV
jgi:adenine phosphoribosyltransferase